MIKKLITIQHCQSEQHLNGMVGGATDWPLTDLGIQQANKIGLALSKQLNSEFTMVSSDLIRARQTAEIVARYLNITPRYNDKLREQSFGSATGKSKAWFQSNSLPKGLPLIYHKLLSDAESGEEVYFRVSKAIEEMEENKDQNVIVVGHGGSIAMLVAAWLKMPLNILQQTMFAGSAGGVSFMTLRNDNVRVLNQWNNLSYIQP